MFIIGLPAFFLAIWTSLGMAVYQFFTLPREGGWVRLGENFGKLAVFLAIDVVLCAISPSGPWESLMSVPLLFAGLSGFLKTRRFPIIATVIATLFLSLSGGLIATSVLSHLPFLSPEEPPLYLPPPPEMPLESDAEMQEMLSLLPPPQPPSSLERIFNAILLPISAPISFFMTGHSALTLGICYLFGLTGTLWSVLRR